MAARRLARYADSSGKSGPVLLTHSDLQSRTQSSQQQKMALTETLTDVEMRFLTYTDLPNHRTNAGRTYLDPQWLKRHCPLDNNSSRLVPASTNASSSQLGSLKLLPLEVIHLILIEVDLQTLTDFRAINWCARSIGTILSVGNFHGA